MDCSFYILDEVFALNVNYTFNKLCTKQQYRRNKNIFNTCYHSNLVLSPLMRHFSPTLLLPELTIEDEKSFLNLEGRGSQLQDIELLNQSSEIRFILLGLSDVPYLKVIAFLAFLVIYVITLLANFLLIIAVRINPKLHTPMYFFLTNLSFIDICFATTVVPKILKNTLSADKSVSLLECAIQMHFHLGFGSSECFLLAIMSYDRFAAICRPLHYTTIMSKKMCISMAAATWISSFIHSILEVTYTFQLSFCHSNHLNHFFCEVPPFFKIACSDTWLHEVTMFITAGIIASLTFLLILVSYVQIVSTILKINSSDRSYKTFSTCVSHIIVVTFYYGTIMILYLRPRSLSSPNMDKSVAILYSAVTPMLNPIIYSVRNKDVKNTVIKNLIQDVLRMNLFL
ncbi:olfactory receptor 5AR1-like [Ranitomeya imitator]|uniref:olfactory receptor 5AR1-like n=1 Tax=Ranitomeya imitator TaxID=111125 RepID=UPI0037E96B1F